MAIYGRNLKRTQREIIASTIGDERPNRLVPMGFYGPIKTGPIFLAFRTVPSWYIIRNIPKPSLPPGQSYITTCLAIARK